MRLDDTIQVVIFSITEKSTKKVNYAIPIEQIKEIRTVGDIIKSPKSKSYVKGMMNLRGKIIPIIDVKNKMGLYDSNTSDFSIQRVLVTDVDDTVTGLLVDEVNEVIQVNTKDIEPIPQDVFEVNYIKGIIKVDKKLLILLDVSEFLKASFENIEESSEELSGIVAQCKIDSSETHTEMDKDDTDNETTSSESELLNGAKKLTSVINPMVVKKLK